MSGMFKAIGKAFKAVFKVVSKIALPVLAIGAIVLTGGAAVGLLPSITSLGSSLGLSAGLTTVLSTAAQGATLGALGSAVTGGDIVKGATMGFATGGILGGIGAVTQPAVATANTAAATGAQAAGTAISSGVPVASTLANGAVAVAPGVESVLSTIPALAAPAGGGILGGIGAGTGVLKNVGSGILNFANKNPMVTAGLIQGIGAGIMASEQSADQRRQREQIMANYDTGPSLYGIAPTTQYQPGTAQRYDDAIYRSPPRITYDPTTGRAVVTGG